MPGARIRYENESFESLIRRYNRSVEKEGLLQEVRKREFFEKPSLIRKRARQVAIRRQRARTEQENMLRTKEGRMKLALAAKKREKQEEKIKKQRDERAARHK